MLAKIQGLSAHRTAPTPSSNDPRHCARVEQEDKPGADRDERDEPKRREHQVLQPQGISDDGHRDEWAQGGHHCVCEMHSARALPSSRAAEGHMPGTNAESGMSPNWATIVLVANTNTNTVASLNATNMT